MDDIAALQHMSGSAGLATPAAEKDLAGAASSQGPGVRLGTEATCTRRCEEVAPDTHDLHTAVVGSSPVPWVGAVVGRASAGDRVLE